MQGFPNARGLLTLTSGFVLALACGSRTGLPGGRVDAGGGAAGASSGGSGAGTDPPPPMVECQDASTCPQPDASRCGTASCVEGSCVLEIYEICDDGDPCTVDTCRAASCVFLDARVDADADGAYARGSASDPNAALGCGDDCDDGDSAVYPGALERCDSLDNDCNGVADDGTMLVPATSAPVRVSPLDAGRADATGLAFDGERFGATLTLTLAGGTKQGHFRALGAQGSLLGDSRRIARVNAESYGGPLVWAEQRYMTAYGDARQGNYEIYLDLLNRAGERLIDDLRVTEAEDFSLEPSLVWTGAEGLMVWGDRRFESEAGLDAPAIMGQRVSLEGKPIGPNLRLTPAGVNGESPQLALSDKGIGIAFTALDGQQTRLEFMTASRSLEQASTPILIDLAGATDPAVVAVAGKYVLTFHYQEAAAVGPAIFAVVVGPNGVERGPVSLTSGAPYARSNATHSYGDRFVMVWADTQDGPYQLYAQTFDATLAPLSPRQRVVFSNTKALDPVIAPAADGGLGVLYVDEGLDYRPAVYFTRLDCQAAALP